MSVKLLMHRRDQASHGPCVWSSEAACSVCSIRSVPGKLGVICFREVGAPQVGGLSISEGLDSLPLLLRTTEGLISPLPAHLGWVFPQAPAKAALWLQKALGGPLGRGSAAVGTSLLQQL